MLPLQASTRSRPRISGGTDNPITGYDQDLLRRAGVAKEMGDDLRLVDAAGGYVTELMGQLGDTQCSTQAEHCEALGHLVDTSRQKPAVDPSGAPP